MVTEHLPRDGLILCAVSGGADSVCLLARLRELGFDTAAAHFHHGLRGPAADRDAAFVKDLCGMLGVPLVTERGDVRGYAAAHRMGVEEAARVMRYAFLERTADALGAAVIATAHTADDNAETVLMHLTRGAGLAGLGGIPPVRGRIVRPLLDETHAQALAYLEARGLPHVEDETNGDDDCLRNRLRHHVLPALRAENPAFSAAVFRTTALLREDERFLAGLAKEFLEQNARENTLPADALTALPRPVALRAVRLMAPGLGAEHARTVLALAERGGCADVSGLRVAVSGGLVVFGAAEKAPLPDRRLEPGAVLALPEAGLSVRCEKIEAAPADVYRSLNTFFFACDKICGNISVGAKRPGDRFRPARRGCTKEVRRLLAEAGVPAWERGTVPVLRDDSGILGIPGVGPAERACAEGGGRNVLRIEFTAGGTNDA